MGGIYLMMLAATRAKAERKCAVLATWVIRSKIRDFRRNDFSLRSHFSLTGDAGLLSPQWCELHVSLEGTT